MQESKNWSAGMALCLMALLVVGLAGCVPSGVRGVRAFDDLPPAKGEVASDAAFFFELSQKQYCSTDDAYRGMLYLIDGTDTSRDLEERTARLVMHGVADKNWKHNPNAVATKGKIAYMLVRALEIRGGVMYNVTNGCGRYALRELIHNGMIKGGTERSKISGAEYVGILGRADDRRVQAQAFECF